MFISQSFKQDVLSKNTKIIPIVIIEKFITDDLYDYSGFSTDNLEISKSDGGSIYFKPLLMSLPKLKESIDITTGRYKISSVTLNFSNFEYNGTRISDLFTNNLLINENVSIHLKSQSCTTVTPYSVEAPDELRNNDCATLYVGKIRSISHTDEKLIMKLEDLTEQKIHKDLPEETLGDDDTVPDKYKNKSIPMVYGKVHNAPLVGEYRDGRITFIPDNKEIHSINEDLFDGVSLTDTDFSYGSIKTYEGAYIPILKFIQKKFVTNQYTDDEQTELNEEYVDFGDNYRQYYVNDDNTISLENGGLWSVNRVQGVYDGKPNVVNLIRTNVASTDLGFNMEGGGYIGESVEMIDNVDLGKITDNDIDTSITEQDITSAWSWVGLPVHYNIGFNSALNVPYSLRWETSVPSAKFTTLIRTSINGYKLPVRGYDEWSENKRYLIIAPDDRVLNRVNNLNDLGHWSLVAEGEVFQFDVLDADIFPIETYNDLSSLFSMSANHGNNEDNPSTDWKTQDCLGFGFSYTWNNNASIKFKTEWYGEWQQEVWDFQGTNPAIDCLPVLRFHDGRSSYINIKAPENYYCIDFLGLSYVGNNDYSVSSNKFHLDAYINEIDVFSLVELDDAPSKDYYANINGRVDLDISDGYLENPIHIMRHILKEELGITKFDEDEYDEAVAEHNNWKFAFSVKDRINSKKLIEDLSKSTFTFPRLKNNGDFGFVTIKSKYEQDDYDGAAEIYNADIIGYNFTLTPPEKIISKLDFEYGYDYGAGEFLKINKSDEYPVAIIGENNKKFNGIEDAEDNKKILNSKYIQEEATAKSYKLKKFLNENLSHLTVNINLPLQYSEIEVGTLVKFEKDKLIDGIKAYGMDYTNPIAHGTVVRFPLFLVTDVQRGLESISISCYQLHWLELPMGMPTNPYYSFQSDAFWNINNFPNINWIDPAIDLSDFNPNTEWNIPVEDYTDVPSINFLIGADSEFNIDDEYFPSSYIRYFRFTSEYEYVNLGEIFDGMFGLSNFGLSDWSNLIPEKNTDGSGYGPILNGAGTHQVGQFVAIDIKMQSENNDYYILSLRNIHSTVWDPDFYDEDNVLPFNMQFADSNDLKLGWVLYNSNSEWEYDSIYNSGGSVDSNLDLFISLASQITSDTPSFEYSMVLYPHYIPDQTLKLNYTNDYEGQVSLYEDFSTPPISSDDIDILVLVETANLIMSDEYQENYDLNSDGILDIFDIILMINIIMGED